MTERLKETIDSAIHNALANTHTCAVAKVVAVNATTLDVKPVVSRVVDGKAVELPVFVDVPPIFLQGGTSYTAHPISVGDSCLLFFAERATDYWYSGNDNVAPLEVRMHDYSDGFAIVGINPLAAALTIPNVITHIGNTYAEGNYEQVGDYDHTGERTHLGNHTTTGVVTVNGSLIVNAQAGDNVTINGVTLNIISGDVIADGISLKNHVHGGVQPGTGTTGAPQ